MSLLQRLRQAHTVTHAATQSASGPPVSAATAPTLLDEEIPRYPPFIKGLPLPPLPQLLATQQALIERLQRELILGPDDDGTDLWETYVAPVIERYVAFVHLIPASEVHHHRGAGGLYRHGLETAFHAARASRGVLVGLDRPRVEQRRLEPRLRVAAALGGLLHDAGKVIYDVSATDRTGHSTWSPIDEDLSAWAARLDLDRYFLHWREQRHHGGHELFNVAALKRILPSRVERWLSQPDPELYGGFLAAVTGVPHSSVLVELVRQADRHSVERDLREHRIAPIDTAVGVPVDRYLLDAMRRLLHDGRWRVNVPGARVWLLREGGLHLVWPGAAQDITELLAADRVPGIPRDPHSIAELLLERDLAVARVDAAGRHATWRLAPAVLAQEGAKPILLTMLRLKDPELLFPDGAPPAVATAGEGTPSVQVAQRAGATPSEARPPSVPCAPGGDPAEPSAHAAAPAGASEACTEAASPSDPAPPSPLTAARAWLSAHSASSARLLALVTAPADASDQDASDQQAPDLTWRDGLLWLRYPAWFSSVGWEPAAAAQALSDDGLLEPDPRTPMRRVREQDGARWLVLTAEVSARLQPLLREPAEAEPPEAEPQDSPSLIPAILAALDAEHGPGDGSQVRVLGYSELKALARRHGLGVYSLRKRLLSDPRFRLGAHQRIEVIR
ncbi:MobH family relaxase [Thiohalocapsa marina]|uniref:MobH family relaxase n=1 Tax=Thiohalocapsa marina TaxID=424902 RepID=UPI0036DC78A3